MTAPRRWIRLDIGWEHSDWLAPLSDSAKLAWIYLLGHTKAYGVCGAVKAMTPVAAARTLRVPEADFSAMLAAGLADGAIVTDGQTWAISAWDLYQNEGNAERQRRYRADRSRLSPLRDKSLRNGMMGSVTDSTVQTLTLTGTVKKTPKKGRWTVCPESWNPTEKHTTLATELKVPFATEVLKFREWEFKEPKTNADLAFTRWLRQAHERLFPNGHKNGDGKPRGLDIPLQRLGGPGAIG